MAASIFDSPLYAQLFPTGDTGRLFSDSAALRAMLVVEGSLAKAQGSLGLIPEISAAAIQRASLEIQIDPGALAKWTGLNGVCVPSLVEAFRTEMNAPEHAQYVHWGATSQDIIDSGLMLRLRQALLLAETDLRALLTLLADQAETHADSPMLARTYGQHAVVTTWGAVLAGWGGQLADAVEALPTLRDASLWVSLSGAAGTASALGEDPAALRAALAAALGLKDPARSWHTDRGPILRITNWMAGVTATLGGMGQTLTSLAGPEIGEIAIGLAGTSSTMPQKQNPVGPAALTALSHSVASQSSGLNMAAQHQHQRDGAAWFTEWMLVPQTALATASSLQLANSVLSALTPQTTRMRSAIEDGAGLCHAEALSFALSARLPRPEAQKTTKELCARALAENTSLRNVATARFPDLAADIFETDAQLGCAPGDARAFAARVRSL